MSDNSRRRLAPLTLSPGERERDLTVAISDALRARRRARLSGGSAPVSVLHAITRATPREP